tara:strand:+ start:65 stop:325 length:261 start_codon:yes stop_codon:yes gene_type:complete
MLAEFIAFVVILTIIFIIFLTAFLADYSHSASIARLSMKIALDSNCVVKIKNALIMNEKYLDKDLVLKVNSRIDDLVFEKDKLDRH